MSRPVPRTASVGGNAVEGEESAPRCGQLSTFKVLFGHHGEARHARKITSELFREPQAIGIGLARTQAAMAIPVAGSAATSA